LTGDDAAEADNANAKPAPKRKGRPPKTKAQFSDIGTSLFLIFLCIFARYFTDIKADPEPSKSKARMSKAKLPGKTKVKTKLAEAPQSDDEGTLVEAPRPKAHSKRKPVIVTIDSDNEDESMPDNKVANTEPSLLPKSAYNCPSTKDAPLNRAQARQRTENHKERAHEGNVFICVRNAAKISPPIFNSRADRSFSNTETFKAGRSQ